MTITRQWKSPGNTFPKGTENLPAFQEARHSLGIMTLHEEGVLTWEISGIKVFLRFTMWDGQKKINPNLVIEPEPRYLDSQNYWRTFIQAPKGIFNGTLQLAYRLAKVPDPVDPPPPIVIPPDTVPDPVPNPPNVIKFPLVFGNDSVKYEVASEEELIITQKTVVPRLQ
jgi:hypothetical protein